MNPETIFEDIEDIEFAAKEIMRGACLFTPRKKRILGIFNIGKPSAEALARDVINIFAMANAENLDISEAISNEIKKMAKAKQKRIK